MAGLIGRSVRQAKINRILSVADDIVESAGRADVIRQDIAAYSREDVAKRLAGLADPELDALFARYTQPAPLPHFQFIEI